MWYSDVVIAVKNGKLMHTRFKTFRNEEELRDILVSNIDAIPVSEINEEDESIVAWCKEFPVEGVGSIDIVAVGDGGGIYLIETKLSGNFNRREVIGQVLDYASGMWKSFARNGKEFLERLKNRSGADIPQEDGEFFRKLDENLTEANFNILIAMDGVDEQTKTLIKFLNQFTDLKFIALEIERYATESEELEIIVPRLHGEEVTKIPRAQHRPDWSLEKVENELQKISDERLKERLSRILEFAKQRNIFHQLKNRQSPAFGIAYRGKLVLSIGTDGGLFAYIGQNEIKKYPSVDAWKGFVQSLKDLGFYPPDFNPETQRDGRSSQRKLNDLSDEEFERFLKILDDLFKN
ncbi:hypothetical protein HRbin02_01348 [Candidatus Calditenuaceae archaeon HR02]|nr:hypothetical protein HRbin02_01348 [Candidatus Calditenuaceae archaeon HR02]